MVQNTHLEVVEIGLQNNEIYLQPCGVEREEKVLLPTATERRNRRMIEAEEMRRQGMGFREIAERMELPERTVRSWVSFIGARDEVLGASENNANGTPPAKEGNESRHQKSSGERGGGFGLLQPKHVATPSLTLPIAIGT